MFTLPELPYAFDALEPFIDAQTMEIHHDRHHAAYVKNLNDALAGYDNLLNMEVVDLLANLDKVSEEIRTKVRNNGGGHANHSLFWTLMTGEKTVPSEDLVEIMDKSFGNMEMFKEKFTAAAMGRFGSGWVWLVKTDKGLEIVDTANQDSPISNGQKPILALDVWEHAYYLKYQNRRVDYVSAWWNVVNWDRVSELFATYK